MKGKDKCKILKEIRREIARENDINLVIKECTHQGECQGTCPRCESEVRKLEEELEKRRKAGKAIAVVGIAAALVGNLTACAGSSKNNQLEGSVANEYTTEYATEEDYETGEIIEPDFIESDTEGIDCTEIDCTEEIDSTEEIYELDGDVAYTIPTEEDDE